MHVWHFRGMGEGGRACGAPEGSWAMRIVAICTCRATEPTTHWRNEVLWHWRLPDRHPATEAAECARC